MPEISLFLGIRITMNWNDHNPPHFHVEYGDYKALVAIKEGFVFRGFLPNRQLRFVLAWCEMHRDELLENWERARQGLEMLPIPPLQ